VYVLANLCELRLPAERIVAIIADHCGSPVTGVGEAVSRVTNII
jgi:hypothetical protein